MSFGKLFQRIGDSLQLWRGKILHHPRLPSVDELNSQRISAYSRSNKRKMPKQVWHDKLRINSLFIGRLLVAVGLFLIVFTPAYKSAFNVYQEKFIPKSSVEEVKADQGEPIQADGAFKESGDNPENYPTKIIIPSLNLDLPVTPSRVVKGYWEVSATNASFGLGSNIPGKAGNTVIFAHARDGLFGDLPKIKKEEVIYVLSKKSWYQYKIEEIKEVYPSQIEVIKPTEDERLTLFTCSGFADTKRLIVVAKRITN